MTVADLWVAAEITRRLGEPTVAALSRRLDTDGRCASCQRPLGNGRISLRACPVADLVELTAHHARCAPSQWVADRPASAGTGSTYAAVTAAMEFGQPDGGRRLVADQPAGAAGLANRFTAWWRRRYRQRPVGLMAVNPSVDTVHVRLAAPGEAVDADMETLRRMGFHEAGPGSLVHSPTVGVTASLAGELVRVHTPAGVWQAPASAEIRACVRHYRGLLVMPTTEVSVRQLRPRSPAVLLDGLARGQVLFAWAPLAGADATDLTGSAVIE